MQIVDTQSYEKIYEANGSVGYKILSDTKQEIVELKISSGGKIDLHSLPFQVVFYIIKGNPTLLKSSGKQKIVAGTTISVLPDEERGWQNTESDESKILVIKYMGK